MANDLDPKNVEAFLRANPNFLQDRPGLLAVLNLPHGGEGAVSLIERQVSVLRERNIASRQKLNALTDIGRQNDRLLEATRQSILALLGAENRGELSRTWIEQIRDTFRADAGVLLWMDTHSEDEAALVADKLIRQGESFSGVLRPEEMRALFNTEATLSEAEGAMNTLKSGILFSGENVFMLIVFLF